MARASPGRAQAVEILHQHGDLSDYLVPLFTRKDEVKELAAAVRNPVRALLRTARSARQQCQRSPRALPAPQ